MKTCGKCKKEKDSSQFSKHKSTSDGLCWMCKSCKSLQMKIYFSNSNEFKRKYQIRKNQILQKANQMIFEYLINHPCVDCGEKDIRTLEFDHIFDTKIHDISTAKYSGRYKILIKEIKKCEVRCGNCHRKRTGISYPSFKDKEFEKMQKLQ